MTLAGAALFARFAYPPNELGYCGPAESQALFEYGSGGERPDADLVHLAHGFDGAWPYLELLAGGAGLDDPLHPRVVEAYWLGNDLLGRVGVNDWGWHLVDRFGPRAGVNCSHITSGVGHGAVANHAFHVFGVYPWVGLLREGRGGTQPRRVVDRCRIRWGTVLALSNDSAVVLSRPLAWDGSTLALAEPRPEEVRIGSGGACLGGPLAVGDSVALHWDWVCQRIRPAQRRWLESVTTSQLRVINNDRTVSAVREGGG